MSGYKVRISNADTKLHRAFIDETTMGLNMANIADNSVLQEVDAKTQLVGHNRLELLLFRLTEKQRYGINVFKVREVINCPEITKIPHANVNVAGIANIRGNTFVVIDLQSAMGMEPLAEEAFSNCSVIVTEYNRKTQGFLVPHVEHIVNKNWEDIHAPPPMSGSDNYLTGVTQIDDQLIEILDVEKVLYEIAGASTEQPEISLVNTTAFAEVAKRCHVLVVDDSMVARNQVKRTVEKLGIPVTLCKNGKAGLDQLVTWQRDNADEFQRLALIISDVEMPEMDGYTLTAEIRKNENLKSLNILLHTSLSGVFDSSLLEKVKADGFLAKFNEAELLASVKEQVEKFSTTLEKRGL